MQYRLEHLAIPFSILLVSSLAYGSQSLFHHLEPGPLSSLEAYIFNTLVICVWICYFRCCFVNPGHVPKVYTVSRQNESTGKDPGQQLRWCRKCKAAKPPRAHHCKICSRCIPKMDHHCPWIANCVSIRTLPHFIRFLFYGVMVGWYLEYLLFLRFQILWEGRNWPSYLGPSTTLLSLLCILSLVNSINLFVITILFTKGIWAMGGNVTTIEGWEIEQHEKVVRRARRNGGMLHSADGKTLMIAHQEFPYDVGIWRNICQVMGTSIPILWVWPLALSISSEQGLDFEVNGFSDEPWPPLNPDKIPRPARRVDESARAFMYEENDNNDEYIAAFKHRQSNDLRRVRTKQTTSGTTVIGNDKMDEKRDEEIKAKKEGGLAEFGVDEDAEAHDDYDDDEDDHDHAHEQ